MKSKRVGYLLVFGALIFGSVLAISTADAGWPFDNDQVSVNFNSEEGTLTVTRRVSPSYTYAVLCHTLNCATPPDDIMKTTYGAVDGKITVIKTRHGKVYPRQETAERTVWADDE